MHLMCQESREYQRCQEKNWTYFTSSGHESRSPGLRAVHKGAWQPNASRRPVTTASIACRGHYCRYSVIV